MLTTLLLLALQDARPDGPFVENHPNGKPKIKATTKGGQLHGKFTEYYENGKTKVAAGYNGGKLQGFFKEFGPKGGAPLRDQYFKDGILIYPKPQAQIAAVVKRLNAQTTAKGPLYIEPPSTGKTPVAGRVNPAYLQAALAQLKTYRYLADIPYEDLTINEEYCRQAQHAAVLLKILGRLDHTPERPADVPEDFFKIAYDGTSQSNLHWHSDPAAMTLVGAVDGWMDDSDKSNIAVTGHRRWSLNPSTKEVGYGIFDGYAAHWCFDKGRTEVPDYDLVCFPSRGYHPVAYFKPDYAWSASLNPEKYKPVDAGSVKVSVWAVDDKLRKGKEPLELNHRSVDTGGFGIPNTVIFRPKSVSVASAQRYWVEIAGLKDAGGADTKVEYLVEFCP